MQFYHDKRHDVLVYDQAPRALEVIKDARPLSNGYVAVPRNLYNCQLLRWIGLPVPPIIDNYDWPRHPSIAHPTQAQVLMANHAVLHPKSFNLSDMGTMKTLATLWAADYLMQCYPKGDCRALIVAPLSILQRVWGDALFGHFAGRRSFEIIHGSAQKRRELLSRAADFYIINYDGLSIGAKIRRKGRRRVFEWSGLSQDLLGRTDIRIAIIDEASAYRDSSTDRSRFARALVGQRDYLWLLTGTPTPNGPTDAYGLAKLVNDAFGETYTSFRSRTMIKLSNFKFVPARGSYQEARKLLSPAIRFDIKDVWDGPELTTQQREIELTSDQRKQLKDLKNQLQITMPSGEIIIPPNEAASRTKAIQICLGAVYDHDHKAHEIDAATRIKEALSVVAQSSGKVLVFANLTSVLLMLYRIFQEQGVSCATVYGQTKNRADLFRDFQQGEHPRVLIADPATMAHGLDLWAATTVLWYGPTDKTEHYLQANKRAHRPGQRYPVTIVQLAATALEREIFKRLERNESLQGVMLGWVRGIAL